MKKYKAKTYEEGIMVLSCSEEIQDLYNTIEQDEDFILEWKDDKGITHSEMIIANNIIGKIRTGDIKLVSVCEEE